MYMRNHLLPRVFIPIMPDPVILTGDPAGAETELNGYRDYYSDIPSDIREIA